MTMSHAETIEAATSLASHYLKVQTSDVWGLIRRARAVQPMLTERSALVLLLVASRSDGMSLDEITAVFAWQKGMTVAVLRGLVCELRLLDVSPDGTRPWLRIASLSVAGVAAMAALNGPQDNAR